MGFVVAGGLHHSNGDSSSEGGMVIDLDRMRNITVSTDTMTVNAQGGCRIADIEKATAPHKVACIMGTVSHTGIGGYTLGGGYGWLSGQYGLAIDNTLAVEMVLADGSIVNASTDSHPDLFWAVRGAGHSFGIATSITYRAHPQPEPVWAGLVMWPANPATAETLVSFANKLAETSGSRAAMHLGFTSPPPMAGGVAMIAAFFYNGPATEAEKLFAPVLTATPGPIINQTGAMPYHSVSSMIDQAAPFGKRHISKATAVDLRRKPEIYGALADRFATLVKEVPDAASSICLIDFIFHDAICSIANDATAFANRGRFRNVLICPSWSRPEDDAACTAWASDTAAYVRKEMDGLLSGPREYLNYDTLGTPASSIFGANYERLVKLKGQYDPTNQFLKSHGLRASKHD